jgi:hypothetical protein
MNALARTSRETMLLQKYREACAKAREAIQVLKDPKRKLTDSERRAIVSHVDDILGIRWDTDEQSLPSDLGSSSDSQSSSSSFSSSSSSGPSSSPPFPAPVCPPDAQQSPEHAPTGVELHRTPDHGEKTPAAPRLSEAEPSRPSSTQAADSPSTAAENSSEETLASEETLIAQLSL